MSVNEQHTLRIPPIRSIREFVGGNEWSKPPLNPSELQKQMIANLVYYQSNYGIILIPFLLVVGYFRPMSITLGLLVFTVLLAAFVYSSRQHTAITAIAHDRPIVILILLLVLAFLVIRMFGTVFIFLLGIVLPFALIIGHATARKQTLQNKAENTVENLSLQATPMGLLLSYLGAKHTEAQESSRRQ